MRRLVVAVLLVALGAVAPAHGQADERPLGEAAYLETLQDRTSTKAERQNAAYWILKEEFASPKTVDVMLAVVDDETIDVTTREILGHALGGIAKTDDRVRARLIEQAAAAGSPRVRWGLAVALRHPAETDDASLAALVARAGDDDPSVRLRALRSMTFVRFRIERVPEAAALVRAAAADDDGRVRALAIGLADHVLPPGEAVDLLADWWLELEPDWTGIFGQVLRMPAVTDADGDAVAAARRLAQRFADALTHDDPVVRRRACAGLAGLRHWAVDAVPRLAARLSHPEPEDRLAAARALARLGPHARAAAPALAKAIRDPDPRVAAEAVTAMAQLEGDAAVAGIARSIDHDDATVRAAAAERAARGLRRRPELLDAFVTLLDDPVPVVRTTGLAAYRFPRDADAFAEAWSRIMAVPRPDVRAGAVRLAGRLWTQVGHGPASALRERAILPRVLAVADAPEPAVRAAAAEMLISMQPGHPEVIDAMIPRLADDDVETRRNAARVLGAAGPPAAAALPRLIAALDDGDVGVVVAAARALGGVGAGRPAVADALIARFERVRGTRPDDRKLRVALLGALGDVGPVADTVVPVLAAAATHDERLVRRAALAALDRIGPERDDVREVLLAAVDDPDRDTRKVALLAFGRRSGRDETAARALTRWYPDPDVGLRRLACGWTGGSEYETPGPAARVAVPALIDVREHDEHNNVRVAAIRALLRVEPGSARVRAALVDALRDPYSDVRLLAARGLGRQGAAAAGAVPALEDALDDHAGPVVGAAAEALARIGPAGTAAATAITAHLGHPRPDVASAIVRSLAQLAGHDPAVVTALIAALDDDEPARAAGAARALGLAGAPAAVPAVEALHEAATRADARVRRAAAEALQRIERSAGGTQADQSTGE